MTVENWRTVDGESWRAGNSKYHRRKDLNISSVIKLLISGLIQRLFELPIQVKVNFMAILIFPQKVKVKIVGIACGKPQFFLVKENQFSKYQSFNGSFNKFNDLLTCGISLFHTRLTWK